MGNAADYDTHIVAWSEEQAALLRGLARDAMPNALDLGNIAEEIEGLGRSVLNAVESHVRNMLVHAIKAASTPPSLAVRKWQVEIGQARIEANKDFVPSMRRRSGLAAAWRRAVQQARLQLQGFGDVPLGLPDACPFTLDDLLDEARPLDWHAERLREVANELRAAE